jgi:hypothetical protein
MSADLVVYNQSIEEKPTSSVMADKKWLSVIDQNNGSYSSGQSTLETTSLSTSDRMMNYREAYLSVPLLLTAGNQTSSNTAGLPDATDKSKLMGLKNSYTSIVHSMSVDLNGTNIIQTTPFSELYNAFCLMTSLSWDDVKTQGSTIGFYPDDALAATSYTADNLAGTAQTTVNNRPRYQPNQEKEDVLGHEGNMGYGERLRYINYDATGRVLGEDEEDPQSAFLTKANATVLYKNQVLTLHPGGASDSPVVQVQVMAIIKLRHLHSFFSVVPLSRGLQFRFIINFNQTTTKLTSDGTTLTGERLEKTQFGGVNPLMVTSAAGDQGGEGVIANSGEVRFDLSVGRTCLDSVLASHSGTVSSGLPQSVTLHVPSYIMNPSLAGAYISANSSKRITYSDIYQFKINNISSGDTVNQLITSGIRGVRSVVMMPMLPSASNGATTPEYQSVQSDAGGGPTALLAQVTDFQVQVGGVNQIQTNGRYEWEIFQNYVAGAHGVNAGMTDGLTSSLIGQSDWARKYLYYYIDCNRGTDLERDTPKSIQIQFRNLSAKAMDYFVFVEFENSFALDVGTGNIVA